MGWNSGWPQLQSVLRLKRARMQKAIHPQTSGERSLLSRRTLRGLDWLNFLLAKE
jgi:hypothetical protein